MSSGGHVLIVGDQGQDGRLLSDLLIQDGCEVIGLDKSVLRINGTIVADGQSITDPSVATELLSRYKPQEIYYLAAYHRSSEGDLASGGLAGEYTESHSVHVNGVLNLLSAIQKINQSTRLFYAGSSLVFGHGSGEIKDESSPFTPECIYGVTKASGIWLCKEARDKHGIFASTGILYNHESAFRSQYFLSSKIINHAIAVSRHGKAGLVEVGSLDVQIDMGYALDFVRAFRDILALDKADDYVICTGNLHSVEEFIETVFNYFELPWREYVSVNPSLLTRAPRTRAGNPSKLNRAGIFVDRPFNQIVRRLIEDSLNKSIQGSA